MPYSYDCPCSLGLCYNVAVRRIVGLVFTCPYDAVALALAMQAAQQRRTRRKHERMLKYERCAKDSTALAQWSEYVDHLGNTAWYNYTTQETVYSKYDKVLWLWLSPCGCVV